MLSLQVHGCVCAICFWWCVLRLRIQEMGHHMGHITACRSLLYKLYGHEQRVLCKVCCATTCCAGQQWDTSSSQHGHADVHPPGPDSSKLQEPG